MSPQSPDHLQTAAKDSPLALVICAGLGRLNLRGLALQRLAERYCRLAPAIAISLGHVRIDDRCHTRARFRLTLLYERAWRRRLK